MTSPSPSRPLLAAVFLTASLTIAQAVQATDPGNADFARATQSFHETLGALVAADTSNPPGNEARAVALIAKRLKAEGIAYEITSFAKGLENIVARLSGSGEKKPLLLLAHIDVVGADKQNWSSPAHQLVEKDGFLYGRGTNDDLGMAVINLETLILLKHAGIPLKRDVIAAFTGDEE